MSDRRSSPSPFAEKVKTFQRRRTTLSVSTPVRRFGHDCRYWTKNTVATDVPAPEAGTTSHQAAAYPFAEALDSSSDALWDFDLQSQIIRISGAWLSSHGLREADATYPVLDWQRLLDVIDARLLKRTLLQHLKKSTKKFICEFRLLARDGSTVWALACGKVIARDDAGHALRMVGTLLDITQRKLDEESITHLALHDALTNLPNRTLFDSRLQQELASVNRSGGTIAVLACDLDKFKHVNDTLGHPAGDALLRIVADRIRSVIREGDTLARLGGDEFAILLRRLDNSQEAAAIADRIISAIGCPIEIAGTQVVVGISIGVAIVSTTASRVHASGGDLLKQADLALYKAKLDGRNVFKFFDSELEAKASSRKQMALDLCQAIENKELALHYQPMFDLMGGTIVGLEALMRWERPGHGAVAPALFLPIAEEVGAMAALGEWALQEACRQAVTWPEPSVISVNLAAAQFQQPAQLLLSVSAALVSSGLMPARLELEVNEKVLVENSDAVIACLHDLRRLGVRICLDDFGTGYSSLTYLRRFSFDKIKIDQSLMKEAEDPVTAAIVRAIGGLATRIGADVLAEGVETLDQLEFAKQAGCTQMQGFFESKPLAAIDSSDWFTWEGRRIGPTKPLLSTLA